MPFLVSGFITYKKYTKSIEDSLRRYSEQLTAQISMNMDNYVNDKIDNIVTVGRCISASFEAQAAIRLTPTLGAVGQAGGVAASMAAKEKVSARDVDIKLLHEELIRQGSFLRI